MKYKNRIVLDNYKSGVEVRCDLRRLNDIKVTINDIIEKIETYESKMQFEISALKDKIYQLTTKDSYITNEENQELVKKLKEKIESKESLFQKRNKILVNQLNSFKRAYNKLYSKSIKVKCGDLKEELEKNSNEIFVNLSVGIISYEHSELSNIIDEYQNKTCCMDMAISDKKHPEYCNELNNILYVKRFPVDFYEEQYDGNILSSHLTIDYGLTDDPKKYSYLKINNPNEINLKFKLGDLVKEDKNWKPVKYIREAICNCKDKEYKKNKGNQKIKKI